MKKEIKSKILHQINHLMDKSTDAEFFMGSKTVKLLAYVYDKLNLDNE